MIIDIDFETRSKADISLGVTRYADDPSTEVLGVVYSIDGGPRKLWSPLFEDFGEPEDLVEALKTHDVKVVAHNAAFEYAILTLLSKRRGWPMPYTSMFTCTAARAAVLAFPRSLEGVGAALNLPIQKDQLGKRIMMKMCTPRKPTKNNPAIWHEDFEDFQTLFKYCDRDVEVEQAVHRLLPELEPDERRMWELDHKINLRGLPVDLELAHRMVEYCEQFIEEKQLDIAKLSDGKITTGNQRDRILLFLREQGVVLEDLSAQSVETALQTATGPAKEMLELRQQLGKSSVNKIQTFIDANVNGWVHDTFLFAGASTGRWAGRGVQPHNLPRPVEGLNVGTAIQSVLQSSYQDFKASYPNVLETLSGCIRGIICAPEGQQFLVADFASIESRVLFWLAEEEDGLAIYHGDGKLYETMAEAIFHIPKQNILKGSYERLVAKHAVLGLGYGMGAPKFKATCAAFGVEVTDELAETAKTAYRGRFPKVPAFWYGVERAAIAAVKNPGKVSQFTKIQFLCKGGLLRCKLPSGRKISYPYPRLSTKETPWGETTQVLTFMGMNPTTKKWERQDTYGGKLAENVTQAVANDFLRAAMFRLEENGFAIHGHFHDEILALAKEPDELEENDDLAFFESVMKETPSWGQGCPIEVEGWEGKRFRK